ncbi:hypothetical protein IE53DRAFT_345647 [Violaceomyces palustris]|uniref:Uncharacterized protein n=1 Tax=Violaceomyces palustris TaxID=1673888 RepID=A0ACD0NUU2_9BASI|nr:hypothetical protein IE53DRAFT_345647 [Violaceomyces palustris]
MEYGHQPRQSLYPSQLQQHGWQQQLASLQSCIQSTQICCDTLEASTQTLDEGTRDFSRLSKVLVNQRHFDLVSESEIRRARERISSEVQPHIRELIQRAEANVQRDERRCTALKNKVAQQRIRISQLDELSANAARSAVNNNNNPVGASAANLEVVEKELDREIERERRRLEELRRKREVMSKRVDELDG